MRPRARVLFTLICVAGFSAAPPLLAAVDHRALIQGAFPDGPSVTAKCLECHPEAATQMMATTHWTWSSPQDLGERGKVDLGKKNAINNYCISISSNEPRCTSCHAGYGWKDASFDFTDRNRVDCLVCHDTTGTYKKDPEGAGHPKLPPGQTLLAIAQGVGRSSRATCGACHFYGGGGDGVKHGDLDTSMATPNRQYDVHMGVDGLDFACTECHAASDHRIKGNAMVVSPAGDNQVECTDCHQAAPHKESLLNQHLARISCQTCHIPSFAKSIPTKTYWNWSTAGQDRQAPKDAYGKPTYDKKKGDFTWEREIRPVYAWYGGKAGVHLLGDRMNPTQVTRLNWPEGRRSDPNAKIYPFKVHRGRQMYDKKNGYLIVPNVFGKEGYWKNYDWNLAAQVGMKSVGLPYSGEYDFADTVMYWRINHMVVPAKQALGCLDCHGDKGRMDWKALGYERDPLAGKLAKR
jgi:octaheme c-type cytochrome (tetrathionate reductase family)